MAKSLNLNDCCMASAQDIRNQRLTGKVSGINKKRPVTGDRPFLSATYFIIADCVGEHAKSSLLYSIYNQWLTENLEVAGLDIFLA